MKMLERLLERLYNGMRLEVDGFFLTNIPTEKYNGKSKNLTVINYW